MRTAPSDWLLLLAGWTIFGLVQAAFGTLLAAAPGDALVWLVAHELPLAWFWAAATPVVGELAARLRRRVPSPAPRALAHLPPLVVAALLHTLLRRGLAVALGQTVAVPFEVTLLYYADVTVAGWLGAVWAARLLEARSRLVEGERRALALEDELARARLESLELQLRPHFLFNVLGAVAELAHEAPATAAAMLRNLRTLLRGTVVGQGAGPVTLHEELGALAPYLDIQRLRFSDWLVLEEEVADDARDALVPRLILQPLVENAVQHGLRGRARPGTIAIRARVETGRLRISVTDDGVGLSGDGERRRGGLGLANLRARLATSYGTDAFLELGEEARGGTSATLDLPFQRAGARRELGARAWDDQAAEAAPPAGAFAPIEWVRKHPALAVALAWALVGGLRIQHSYAYLWLRDRFTAAAFLEAVRHDAASAALWCALTPLVFALSRLTPLARRGLLLAASVHASAAVVLAVGHAATIHRLTGGSDLPLLSLAYAQVYAWNVAVYAILLAIAHARALEGWIRERRTTVERLRREIGEARLQGVLLELRPAVLLDCLERLGETVVRDPRQADVDLAALGDYLRATLEAIHRDRVSLAEEAALAHAYARVLALAGGPGLALHLQVPTSLASESVPKGIARAMLDAVLDDGRGAWSVEIGAEADEGGLALRATLTRPTDAPGSETVAPRWGGATGAEATASPLADYVLSGGVEVTGDAVSGLRVHLPRPSGRIRVEAEAEAEAEAQVEAEAEARAAPLAWTSP